MKLKANANIHNDFRVEIRDIQDNSIVMGFAENIILNNLKTSNIIWNGANDNYFGLSIQFGDGSGTIDPARTSLFNKLGAKNGIRENVNFNQVPEVSSYTQKIVLTPAEYIGVIITEVGLGGKATINTIYTHALIKDSEGNPLTLGPKTDTQEITIYSTVYVISDFPPGITINNTHENGAWLKILSGQGSSAINNASSGWDSSVSFWRVPEKNDSSEPIIASLNPIGPGICSSGVRKALTDKWNGKIKKLYIGSYYPFRDMVNWDLEILAENNSEIWAGHEFENVVIGTGDGTQNTFSLIWDEVWADKPKKVFVDGIEKLSEVTWDSSSIIFDTPPLLNASISVSYWVKYVPKDSDHELHMTATFFYNEGAPI